jgi:hypothetical protein
MCAACEIGKVDGVSSIDAENNIAGLSWFAVEPVAGRGAAAFDS